MPITILHTSDWHLGKKLFKEERLEEQIQFLDWLIDEIKKHKADYLLICGDIFDTPAPPSDALKLYFQFLKTVSTQTSCEIIGLAGNHDGGRFLEAPTPFLEDQKIKIVGHFTAPNSLSEKDLKSWRSEHLFSKGPLHIGILPYFRLKDIYALPWCRESKLEGEELILFGLKKWIELLYKGQQASDPLAFRVLCLHHLVGSFMASGSEQGLSLSGLESLPLSLFKDQIDYLALGHIHRPQVLKKQNPTAYYPGSPIPLRFSEKNIKTISKISLQTSEKNHKEKVWSWEKIGIPCFRSLLQVTLHQEKWQQELESFIQIWKEQSLQGEGPLFAFLEITMIMNAPEVGIIDKVREFLSSYPIKLLSYQGLRTNQLSQTDTDSRPINIFNKSELELFDIMLSDLEIDEEKKKYTSKVFQSLQEELYENTLSRD